MIDIGGFVLTSETLITVVGVAIFTAMFVSNFAKPFLAARGIEKESPTYSLYINASSLVMALVFSIAGLVIANIALGSAATLTMALARGFAAAFFATGGYEAYSNITMFVASKKAGT